MRGLEARLGKPTGLALYFLVLTGLFFGPVVLRGKVFLPGGFLYRTPLWYNEKVELQNFDLFDAIIYFYPIQTYLNDSLKRGTFPTWSPYNFAGHPLAFNGQSGFLYPPRLLFHLLFSPLTAFTLSQLVHLFLAGYAMALLARRLSLSPLTCAFAGTVWMFNGYAISLLTFDHVLICCGWLPLSLLAIDRCRRDWWGAVQLAPTVALLATSGHLQHVHSSLLIMAIAGLALLFSFENGGAGLARALVGGTLGMLMAAPLLIPTAATLYGSQRPHLSLAFLNQVHREFVLTSPATFLFPEAYGSPVTHFAVNRIPSGGNFMFPELVVYCGTATVLLALLGANSCLLTRLLALLGVGAVVVPATPLYWLIYQMPGMDRVIPARLVFVYQFCVVLCAAFGFERLATAPRRGAALTGLVLAVLGGIHLWSQAHPTAAMVRLPVRDLFLSDEQYQLAVEAGRQATYSFANPGFLMPFLCLVAVSVMLLALKRPAIWILLLTTVELAFFGWRWNPTIDRDLVYRSTPETQFLQTHLLTERVMGVGTIKPNSLLPFRLQDVGGYDSFYPQHSAIFLSFLMRGYYNPGEQLPAQLFPITRHHSKLVDLLGVRYLVAYPDQELEGYPLRLFAGLRVYENPGVLPRAFLTSSHLVEPDPGLVLQKLERGEVDPRRVVILPEPPPEPHPVGGENEGKIRIVRYSPTEVRLAVESSAQAWLVLTDAYAEGWSASVNATPSPLLRADLMFRAVAVPPGSSEVVFSYWPPGLSMGLRLGSGALLTWLVLLVLAGRTKSSSRTDLGPG